MRGQSCKFGFHIPLAAEDAGELSAALTLIAQHAAARPVPPAGPQADAFEQMFPDYKVARAYTPESTLALTVLRHLHVHGVKPERYRLDGFHWHVGSQGGLTIESIPPLGPQDNPEAMISSAVGIIRAAQQHFYAPSIPFKVLTRWESGEWDATAFHVQWDPESKAERLDYIKLDDWISQRAREARGQSSARGRGR